MTLSKEARVLITSFAEGAGSAVKQLDYLLQANYQDWITGLSDQDIEELAGILTKPFIKAHRLDYWYDTVLDTTAPTQELILQLHLQRLAAQHLRQHPHLTTHEAMDYALNSQLIKDLNDRLDRR
jgi:hypothetical protein